MREAISDGVAVQSWTAQSELRGVIVDALLGTGLAGDVREPYAAAIKAINASGQPVVAVDIPSGLCADTGHVLGVAVRADLSVTFIGLKLGLFTGEAADQVGTLVFNDLQAAADIYRDIPVSAVRLSAANLPRLAPRAPAAHKGRFGHVLLIGGDQGFGGAILLSSESALRSGAGHGVAGNPCGTCPGSTDADAGSHGARHVVGQSVDGAAGKGLGAGGRPRSRAGAAGGAALLSAAANAPLPQVWDADALNLLASGFVSLPEDCVITPHPGEAARLLGVSTAEVQADRPAAARGVEQKILGRRRAQRRRQPDRPPRWASGAVSSRPSGHGHRRPGRRTGRLDSARCWPKAWMASMPRAWRSGCTPMPARNKVNSAVGWRPVI